MAHRNKTKLIQKIQEDKLKQTINIDLEYINIGITNKLNNKTGSIKNNKIA